MSFSERFLRAMSRMRAIVGPAEVGDTSDTRTVRSPEQRQRDLDALGLEWVTGADGTRHLQEKRRR